MNDVTKMVTSPSQQLFMNKTQQRILEYGGESEANPRTTEPKMDCIGRVRGKTTH